MDLPRVPSVISVASSNEENEEPSFASQVLSSLASTLFSYYRPTSDHKARLAEERLLRYGRVPVDEPKKFRQYKTPLGGGRDPLNYVNSIVVDQINVDSPSEERLNVVIMCGFGGALGMFHKNIMDLSEQIPNSRIHVFDWLGTGRSGRPRFPNGPDVNHPIDGIRFFLDSFEEWREYHKLDRFVIVGHSFGSYLSILYALWYPGHVLKLILACPPGLIHDVNTPELIQESGGITSVNGQIVPAWVAWLWHKNITPQCFFRWAGPFGPMVVRSWAKPLFVDHMDSEEFGLFTDYMYHTAAYRGSGEFALNSVLSPGAWAKESLQTHFGKLEVPTTFIYGVNDWMDYRHAQQIVDTIAGPSKVILLPDCGHHLYREQFEAFNRTIINECDDLNCKI